MRYTIVIERGPTSYGAYVPDLPGCVAAAETQQEVLRLIREAISFHLEAMREEVTTRDTPVIVLTAQVLTERDMALLNRGVATVLGKGLFSGEETLAHVEAALVGSRKLGNEAQRLVRRAMAYLHTHYPELVTREGLARHVGVSENYLTRCFRYELGVTPMVYLNRYRLNRAKGLLTTSPKSITEIALAVGFEDSNYFGRLFRREVGVTPRAYRQEHSRSSHPNRSTPSA